MENGQADLEKRKTLMSLAKAGIFIVVPVNLFRGNSMAIDLLNWREGSTPSDDFLIEKVSLSGYPSVVNMKYDVRDNSEGLDGNIKIKRTPKMTALEIRTISKDPKEEKVLNISRQDLGGKIEYTEREFDYSKGKENYNNLVINPEGKTMIDVVDRILIGENNGARFDFYGKRYFEEGKKTKHLIRMVKESTKTGFMIRGKVSERNPRTSLIKAFYKEFKIDGEKKVIPVEIHIDYGVRVKGAYFPLTVKSDLTEDI